jgi:two-component system phosphate regulon sensor histidine kinase PhoR
MRSRTFKLIILLSTILIGLLVCVQLFWLNKIYNFEQKEFSTSVVKSIQGVYEDLELSDTQGTELQKLIEQPDVNSFLFRIENTAPKDSLAKSILNNLEVFGVFTDCKLAVYDKYLHNYLYETYLPAAASGHPGNSGRALPVYRKAYGYVLLYFPHRSKYIISSMSWWIVSGLLLILLLISLGVSMFHLYRQKFLNELQNDFIRNVTHEFQTPLTTLMIGLDAISKPSIAGSPEKREKYIRLLQGQTGYLKQHIEHLMKVLKAESSGMPPEKEKIAPNELVRQAIAQLHVNIEEKGADIQLMLEPQNTMIEADKSGLYVAILNLISNAIKYAANPVIQIKTALANGSYLISVKDNGIGIDPKFQKRLFRKFFRVPTGDIHNAKGLGLGLYFVKKVVDENKGHVYVKSSPGAGSEFTIELSKP